MFVAMWLDGGAIMLPEQETMIRFGAKDTYSILNGEYWRYLSPVFVHVGLIHFGINSFALFYIGHQIEMLVGSAWFLVIYLLSGLSGGIASAVFTVGTSAGASGAIFGLIGVGFVFERLIAKEIKQATGERLRRGPYTGLVIINVILGFILTSGPVRIDNAAHLGGLFGGIVLTIAMLKGTYNRFLNIDKMMQRAILIGFALLCGGCSWLAAQESYQHWSIQRKIESSNEKPAENIAVLNEAIRVFPNEVLYLFYRGQLLALNGEIDAGLDDFEAVLKRDQSYIDKLKEIAKELDQSGQQLASLKVQDLILRYEFKQL